jgi:hypothetical protein
MYGFHGFSQDFYGFGSNIRKNLVKIREIRTSITPFFNRNLKNVPLSHHKYSIHTLDN